MRSEHSARTIRVPDGLQVTREAVLSTATAATNRLAGVSAARRIQAIRSGILDLSARRGTAAHSTTRGACVSRRSTGPDGTLPRRRVGLLPGSRFNTISRSRKIGRRQGWRRSRLSRDRIVRPGRAARPAPLVEAEILGQAGNDMPHSCWPRRLTIGCGTAGGRCGSWKTRGERVGPQRERLLEERPGGNGFAEFERVMRESDHPKDWANDPRSGIALDLGSGVTTLLPRRPVAAPPRRSRGRSSAGSRGRRAPAPGHAGRAEPRTP